ncbi:MAG: hypothetical protein K0R38_6348 [Polyangiaceae bacterium]|jgi:hypothetical protein|nr:hypothetical protein [Polyangiaceae bacterium]
MPPERIETGCYDPFYVDVKLGHTLPARLASVRDLETSRQNFPNQRFARAYVRRPFVPGPKTAGGNASGAS